jgi:BMFP domain-containing protein YqiC
MSGRQRMDDLAGIAGGFASILAGLRDEARAMGRAQTEEMIRRLELARAEEVEAAMEVARRAREQVEALEGRVAALEAKIARLAGAEPQPKGKSTQAR